MAEQTLVKCASEALAFMQRMGKEPKGEDFWAFTHLTKEMHWAVTWSAPDQGDLQMACRSAAVAREIVDGGLFRAGGPLDY